MTEVFDARALRWIIGLGMGSFFVFLGPALFGDVIFGRSSHGPDSYSHSAIGHRAFVEWLEALGIPVSESRIDSMKRAREDSLLLVLAPEEEHLSDPGVLDIRRLRDHPGPVLVSIPKWSVSVSNENPKHVGKPRRSEDIGEVLSRLRLSTTVRRGASAELDNNPLAVEAAIPDPQLLERVRRPYRAVISGDDGVLLARSRNLWVLSDPDIFTTRGLANDATALFALELLEHVRQGRPIVVDETIHGHQQRPGAWREFFEFPLILLLIQGLLVATVAIWRGSVRFGEPRDRGPRLPAGKSGLVDNTALLLAFSRREADTAVQYLHTQMRIASTRARMDRSSDSSSDGSDALLQQLLGGECPRAIVELSKRRDTTESPEALVKAVQDERANGKMTPRTLLSLARRIQRWKQEIVDGSAVDPSPRR